MMSKTQFLQQHARSIKTFLFRRFHTTKSAEMMSKPQILQQPERSIPTFLFRRFHTTLSDVNKTPQTSIKSDLEQWLKQDNQVKPYYVRGLIKNLRDSNQSSKALEASQWMSEQKTVFNFFPEDYAAQLHLVDTVLGLDEAEKYFKSIPENMKDYSVYNVLLTSYTRSDKTLDKAEATFKKMRDLGFLLEQPSPFNTMISLYYKLKKQDMVEKLQIELKEKNVEIDGFIERLNKMKAMEKEKLKPPTAKIETKQVIEMEKAHVKKGVIDKVVEFLDKNQETIVCAFFCMCGFSVIAYLVFTMIRFYQENPVMLAWALIFSSPL